MSTRIKGATLLLEIGETNYKADLTSYRIQNADQDSDVVTFKDAEEGETRAFTLVAGLIQSTDPDSLMMHIWDHGGETAAYVIAPHGNETPTEAQPHFVGTLTIPSPAELGGDAGRTNTFTTEATFELDGKPRKITTAA